MDRPTPKFPYTGPGPTVPAVSKWANTQTVREVACPRCAQPAGSYCKTPGGRPADTPHTERGLAYREKIGPEEWAKRHTGSMASSALLQKGRIDTIIRGQGRMTAVGSGPNTSGDRAKWRVTSVPNTEVTED